MSKNKYIFSGILYEEKSSSLRPVGKVVLCLPTSLAGGGVAKLLSYKTFGIQMAVTGNKASIKRNWIRPHRFGLITARTATSTITVRFKSHVNSQCRRASARIRRETAEVQTDRDIVSRPKGQW